MLLLRALLGLAADPVSGNIAVGGNSEACPLSPCHRLRLVPRLRCRRPECRNFAVWSRCWTAWLRQPWICRSSEALQTGVVFICFRCSHAKCKPLFGCSETPECTHASGWPSITHMWICSFVVGGDLFMCFRSNQVRFRKNGYAVRCLHGWAHDVDPADALSAWSWLRKRLPRYWDQRCNIPESPCVSLTAIMSTMANSSLTAT